MQVCSGWSTANWRYFTAWQDSLERKSPTCTKRESFQVLSKILQDTTSSSNHTMFSPTPPLDVNLSITNCGASEVLSPSSHFFDRPFPASAGQSHLHQVPAKEFRAFPSHCAANFQASKWWFFPGDPRRFQSTPL